MNMRVADGLAVCAVALLLAGCCSAGPQALSITTIKKLGFKYNLHLVKDGRYGGLDESGNWNGMIGEVVRGEADLAVAPLTVTAVRERSVDITKPFMQTGLSFILRKDVEAEDPGYFSFLCPFSTETWVGILVAYLVTAVCIYLATRLSPCEWAEPQTEVNNFTLLQSLWYVAGALTLQGAGPHPKALSGRVISAIWWLFTVALLACYFANLSSMLHSDSSNVAVKTFEDLANQDIIEYGTIHGSSTFSFFKFSDNQSYRRIFENMERRKSCVATMEEGIRRAQEGNYAFIGESVSLDLVVARYCNLARSQDVIGMRGYSIVAPLGSPLVKNLSVAILELSESGKLDFLRNKWWANSCMAGGAKASSLKPHSLKGMFLKSCCTVLSGELSQRLGNRSEEKTAETPEKSKV
ncbi:hypothetical protein JZ751_014918 [Albula glossodonta]|uniref:Glutamate receptor n=1 Tax=Albula glossodonta TaxID=121402 RepID=A0A8T2MWT1_9TELE|nr:hypothetical protein JZ751_014918 [Albula glossodonta]